MQAPPLRLRQQRNLSEILGHTFNFYGRDWRGFVTIGAGTIPLAVVSTLVLSRFEDLLEFAIANFLLFLPAVAVTSVVEGAIIHHLQKLDDGVESTEGDAYAASFERIGDLLIAVYKSILAALALCITIIGIPAGIERAVRWLFVPQAVMIDGQTRSTALTHCQVVTKNHWWRTFGRFLFIGLAVALVGGAISNAAISAGVVLYALVSAIVGAFTTPFFSIATTLMYFDLKLRQAEAQEQP